MTISQVSLVGLDNLARRGPIGHTIAPVMMKNGHAEYRPEEPYWFVQNQNGDLCGIRCDTPSYSCINRVRLDASGVWWLTGNATANLSSGQITDLVTTGVCDWMETGFMGRMSDRRCRLIEIEEAEDILAAGLAIARDRESSGY